MDNLGELTAQDLYLEILRRSQFNRMQGDEVYKSLMKHRDWWQSAVYGYENKEGLSILLRDLPDNYCNVACLFVIPTEGHLGDIENLAYQWQADEVSHERISAELVVRFWWD